MPIDKRLEHSTQLRNSSQRHKMCQHFPQGRSGVCEARRS